MDQALRNKLARREYALDQRRTSLVKEVIAAGGRVADDSRIAALDLALYYTVQAQATTPILKRNSVTRIAAHRDTLFLK